MILEQGVRWRHRPTSLRIRQDGRCYGATGGLGYETALAWQSRAEIILTGRDDRKGQSAIEKIGGEVTDARVSYQHLDLANLASVADFAQRMHARNA